MGAWFSREIVDGGRLRMLFFLVAFILAFLFIRFSVRMIRRRARWWPGNVTPGGHHIHHVVFGLVFMCVGGVGGLMVSDSTSAAAAALAAVFGAGTALVLDEFALVLHLDDVYWTQQGRLSVQVVFVAVALCGLALLGLRPLGMAAVSEDQADDFARGAWAIAVTLLFNLSMAVITLLKGKVWTGLIGIFVSVFSFVGAVRLARPGSPWARWRYREGSRKLRRSAARERRLHQPVAQLARSIEDLIAGRPSQPRPDEPAAPPARKRE
ncbi:MULTISPECIES: hypothetical protein [Actinomadura]|uniref:Integral membrane protein n=1 Tax=Actinomadura yumaensis TaxID=111807 RepID=A0ABW2CCK2_9ACTN|nr:hypothetical protein [Actinomadura sp. J1-007]MWK38169.1 hypothetical protein [Actinomadura sp. J1-007]